MSKINDIIDYGLIAAGTIYSIDNIEQILGLIVLLVQLIWLLIKLGFKVYNAIKNQKTDLTEGDDYISDFKGEVEDFINKDGVNNDERA